MDKYYFTLGIGYPETVFVIHADSARDARSMMFNLRGKSWAFQYTELEWEQAIDKGRFKGATYLSHKKRTFPQRPKN